MSPLVALPAVEFQAVYWDAFMGNCAPDIRHKYFPVLSSSQYYEWKEYGRKRKILLLFIGVLLFTVWIKQERMVVQLVITLPHSFLFYKLQCFGFVFKLRTLFFFLL